MSVRLYSFICDFSEHTDPQLQKFPMGFFACFILGDIKVVYQMIFVMVILH